MSNYHHKYLKYKTKYLEAKQRRSNNLSGGQVSIDDAKLLEAIEKIDSSNEDEIVIDTDPVIENLYKNIKNSDDEIELTRKEIYEPPKKEFH